MAYQVLARKWRPHNFPEMVGQIHVLRALTNALESNRLHHAYLFTGTRGVGKTTIARILAKSLNCENGITAYPCGRCAACCEIDEGRFVDLIEVDAASRTKVEDTRDLLDNVQYAPTRGRYKVYLIDEVHMLSTHSFNALLKTLEEPPPHVKFLLATTDPQKLPPTILSRCLQFNLKRLPLEQITEHLTKIVKQEDINYENQALHLLAQAADGSLRDALSLLDQAIAYGAGCLSSDDVGSMLGTLDQNAVLELVRAVTTNDAPGLLRQIAQLAEQNPDFVTVLGNILSLLQQIALAQVIPTIIDASQPNGEIILQLAKQLSPEDVQLFYQIALLGRRDLPLSPEPRGGFEMVMLRMLAFRPTTMNVPPQSVQTMPNSSQTTLTRLPPTSITSVNVPTPSVNSSSLTNSLKSNGEWEKIVQSLEISGVVKQLALNCEFKKHEEDIWHLTLSPHYKLLLTEDRKQKLEEILQKQHGNLQKVRIRVERPETETPAIKQQRIQETRQQYAAQVADNDPFIIYMKENCEARINKVIALEQFSVNNFQ
ncbi:DNA polymerase III subunit gamma/tau [Candidatus Parabeggiatoa sp. HSG14]|uniref:DNA polymerase III subunit gamma/tau n=1 Tax=Candidatus Parabeggiatoa sp. HSG14 TaxID=3055593 RepID=UPI0025A92DF1|nr:DNA polymerase III subunit gamma/tau [Thiotrichales bacterium HSG14]